MPHACCFGSPRYRFVSRSDLRTGIDEKEFVHSLRSCLQGHWVREIADEDFDAITEARPLFLRVAHKDPRPVAALEYVFDDLGPNISRRPSNQMCHAVSSE